jgi:hypothetical protein
MILISDHPPQIEDRAVPGHLPRGRTAEDVRAALTARLPSCRPSCAER